MAQPPMLCPHCGAVLELVFLAPGDKAARCQYCDLVYDLPDGDRVVTEEESISPDGTKVKRRAEVSHDGASPSDLMGRVDEMLARVQGQAHAASAQHTVKGVHHHQVDLSTQSRVEGDMPAEVEDMLAGMGITFGPSTGAPSTKGVQVAWPDGNQYSAEIIEERDQRTLVEFSDGSRQWVPRASVRRE